MFCLFSDVTGIVSAFYVTSHIIYNNSNNSNYFHLKCSSLYTDEAVHLLRYVLYIDHLPTATSTVYLNEI